MRSWSAASPSTAKSSRPEPYPQPMEPALGRRFSRLTLTLWIAVATLAAVILWADAAAARTYSVFVAVTVAALVSARR